MADKINTKNPLQAEADQQTKTDQETRVGKDRGYLSLYGYQPDTRKLDDITARIRANAEGRHV
jgi:hypothetical protein